MDRKADSGALPFKSRTIVPMPGQDARDQPASSHPETNRGAGGKIWGAWRERVVVASSLASVMLVFFQVGCHWSPKCMLFSFTGTVVCNHANSKCCNTSHVIHMTLRTTPGCFRRLQCGPMGNRICPRRRRLGGYYPADSSQVGRNDIIRHFASTCLAQPLLYAPHCWLCRVLTDTVCARACACVCGHSCMIVQKGVVSVALLRRCRQL